jgi:mono/diheme cytochrome c family protein
VPAKENVFFQALDKDYMAVQEMATYINVMPGESRSCVGCHEPRRNAPAIAGSRPMALEFPPETPAPQPGDTGVRIVDFTVDIQSIIDQHCIKCHSGKSAKGRLDLANVPQAKFSRSYDNLVATDFIRYRNQGVAANKAVPPLTHGSRVSQFMEMFGKSASASTSEHAKVVLSREEMIRISTWIDANVPYWGSYRGPWKVEQKDRPDFRLLPLKGVTK